MAIKRFKKITKALESAIKVLRQCHSIVVLLNAILEKIIKLLELLSTIFPSLG